MIVRFRYLTLDHPREMPKMLEIRDQLGKLYDGLAGMQADSKVGAMSEARFGYHPGFEAKIYDTSLSPNICCF